MERRWYHRLQDLRHSLESMLVDARELSEEHRAQLSTLVGSLESLGRELSTIEPTAETAGWFWDDGRLPALLPLGYLETDLQVSITRSSETACALLGSTHEQLHGRALGDLVAAESRQAFATEIQALIAIGPGASRRWELQLVPEEGNPFFGILAALVTSSESGVSLRWMLSTRALETDSEARYRQLLASTTDYVYHVEVENGRAVRTTHGPGCVAITGYSPEYFAIQPLLWHTMVHDEDKAAVIEQAEQVLRGDEAPPLEHRIVHMDGSLRWLRNTPLARYDDCGVLVAYDGLITDITERKLAEEALRESEEKYRTLFHTASDAIFVESLDGRILDCNPAACSIFGYPEEELTRLSVANLIPDEILPLLPDIIAKHEQDQGLFLEAFNRRKSGEVFPCEVSTHVISLGGEKRVIAYIRDITERKEAEAARLREKEAAARAAVAEASRLRLEQEIAERRRVEMALRESEAKFRSLAEQSPNMILINKMGRIVYANEVCEEILGYRREELCADSFHPFSLFAPEFVELARSNYQMHRSAEDVAPCEYTLLTRGGARIQVIFSTKLIDYEGESAILAVITDITKRKREEENLRQLQREISDLPAKEQRRIGQLLHDNLGQQLTGIGMLTKSLWQRLRSLQLSEAEEAAQIFSLVREAHSQMRALSRGLVPVEVDAKGLRSALSELAETQSRLPGVSCSFTCTAPVRVEDNHVAMQLYRIAQEAINNALQHGGAEVITIKLHDDGSALTLQVCDDGSGFRPDEQEADGMGLRIMAGRAAAIGAELGIESTPGGGTCVTCLLPLSG